MDVGYIAVQGCAAIGLSFAAWNAASRIAAERRRMSAPCATVLDLYERCMQAHEGQAPLPYEDEFCLAEGEAYRLCRTSNGAIRSGAAAE
jgi:hypothetical protein